MLVIFESILPIFLLVVLGAALKRARFIDQNFWGGLEQLGFYVLFPAYLFLTLAQADYASIDIATISGVYLGAIFVIASALMASWPLMRRNGVTGAQFSSVFQTTTRWNGFIALAIAERIADKTGLAYVAFIIGAIIIPVNFANIGLLIWFGGGKRNFSTVLTKVLTNPLVFASLFGVLYDLSGLGLYQPLSTGLDLLARSALGLGLLMVGAGLHIEDALKPKPLTLLPVFLKLLVFPALVIFFAFAAGVDHATIQLLALAASVPTAMNGYLLAKQMGGDAPLYAAISTLQTAASFITIPIVLALAIRF